MYLYFKAHIYEVAVKIDQNNHCTKNLNNTKRTDMVETRRTEKLTLIH